MPQHRRRASLLARAGVLLAASGVARCATPVGPEAATEAPAPPLPALPGLDRPVSYEREVQPVLKARCVVCHDCYDASCQLLLSSPDGVAR